jgi:hypothetical protein
LYNHYSKEVPKTNWTGKWQVLSEWSGKDFPRLEKAITHKKN